MVEGGTMAEADRLRLALMWGSPAREADEALKAIACEWAGLERGQIAAALSDAMADVRRSLEARGLAGDELALEVQLAGMRSNILFACVEGMARPRT